MGSGVGEFSVMAAHLGSLQGPMPLFTCVHFPIDEGAGLLGILSAR